MRRHVGQCTRNKGGVDGESRLPADECGHSQIDEHQQKCGYLAQARVEQQPWLYAIKHVLGAGKQAFDTY
jgi:hypothetical protein